MINWGISGVKLIPNDHQDPNGYVYQNLHSLSYINYLLFQTEVKSRPIGTTVGIQGVSRKSMSLQSLQPLSTH